MSEHLIEEDIDCFFIYRVDKFSGRSWLSGQFPRVKICCISSVEEAYLAIRYGASALGLVSQMPSGPGVIKEELIPEIVRALPPFASMKATPFFWNG